MLSGRKFQSHPGVPPGQLIELASSSAQPVLGCGVKVAAQGSRTPFASPNGEQQGGFGVDPPTCAGSLRWVPSLEGLGLAKTPRCLPRHVVRVVVVPTRSPRFLSGA